MASSLSTATPVGFIHVSDRDRSLKFYVDTLGLELRSSDPFGDFIQVGPGLVRMTVLPAYKAQPHPMFGWDVADIAAEVTALRDRGVAFNVYDGMGQDVLGVWTSPSGSKVAWFNDPDGNLLSLSQT
jgi:catechol 2,3-dioxygenase-like lactoylglutathione lyase family enzyme